MRIRGEGRWVSSEVERGSLRGLAAVVVAAGRAALAQQRGRARRCATVRKRPLRRNSSGRWRRWWRRTPANAGARRRPVGRHDRAGPHSRHGRHEAARASVGTGVSAERRHARHGAAGPAAHRARRQARPDADRGNADDSRAPVIGGLTTTSSCTRLRAQPARLLLVLEAGREG